MEEIKSPCNNNCRYDYAKRFCIGCYRSMDEIMAWPSLTREEKLLVLHNTEERKKINGGYKNVIS